MAQDEEARSQLIGAAIHDLLMVGRTFPEHRGAALRTSILETRYAREVWNFLPALRTDTLSTLAKPLALRTPAAAAHRISLSRPISPVW